ncbi:MAG: hypothetical protein OXE58_06230, partial [Acidobacteria bacterium]|nr:hypothetical protein [Acidobacteriota bacterium]
DRERPLTACGETHVSAETFRPKRNDERRIAARFKPGWIARRAPTGRNTHARVLLRTPPGMKSGIRV